MKQYTEIGDEIFYKGADLEELESNELKDKFFYAVNCYFVKKGKREVMFGDVVAISDKETAFPEIGEKYKEGNQAQGIGVEKQKTL